MFLVSREFGCGVSGVSTSLFLSLSFSLTVALSLSFSLFSLSLLMRTSVCGCLGAVSQRLRLDEVLMYYRAQRVQEDVIDEAEESITGASFAAAAHHENDTQGVNAERDLDVGEAARQDKATAVEEVASKQLDAPTAEKTSTLPDEAIQTGQEVQERLAGGEMAVEQEEMECEQAKPSPTTGGPARPSPTSGGLLPQQVVPAAASAKEEEGNMNAELARTHTSRPHQQTEVSGSQMQMATTFPRKEERLEAASAAAETASDSFVRMENDSLQCEKRSIVGEADALRMKLGMWELEKHERVRRDVQFEKDNEGEGEMKETEEMEEKKNKEIVAEEVLLRIAEVQTHARLEKKTGEKMKNEEEKETEKEVEMVVTEERLRIEEVQAHVPQLRENEVQACVPQLRESKVQAHMSEQPRTQASGCTSLMPQQPLALQQPLPHSAARRVSFNTAEETGQMTREMLARGVESARVLTCLDDGGGAGERGVALRFALQAAAAQEDAQEAWDAREHWRREESRALATLQDLREQERAASAVAAAARHEAEGAAIAQHAYALARRSEEEACGRAAAAAAVKEEWQAAASTKEFERCRRVDWDTSTGEFESGPLMAANQSRGTWYQGHQHGEVPVSYHMGIGGVVDGFLPGTSSRQSRMQHFPRSTTVGMGTYTARPGQHNVTRAGRRGANNIATSLPNRNSAEAMALSVW